MAGNIEASEDRLLSDLIEFRRDLHRHPELSGEERRTGRRITEELDKLGIPWKRMAGTGVTAEIPGRRDGPRIALRADIDALPIQEENGEAYASARAGVMHACGHDGHTAILLGAARLLQNTRPPELPVRLIFQPAEETGAGALAMIREGVLEGVAAIFAGHIDYNYPAGTMVAVAGAVNASTDGFTMTIRTRGGHAARPHEGGDAIVVGSHLVAALQTLVSRELNPADPAVVTVGQFRAGTAANILADKAELNGTFRALQPGVREQLSRGLRRMVQAAAQMFEAEIDLRIQAGTPPLTNRGDALEVARRAALRVVSEENLRPLASINLGGEDFACYLEKVPGCFVRWGGRLGEGPIRPAHTSRFDFDERVLLVGARYLCEAAREAGKVFGGAPASAS